ncbi:MAG: hypothetical protein JWM93_2350 [Frankiales bacterium]|nr:hypothetical protein [Frankiales bacterium]
MSLTHRIAVGAAALALVPLTGCTPAATTSASPSAAAAFHMQDGFQPGNATEPCLMHQTDAPTAAFQGGTPATLAVQLPFLAYFKANGNKAFCDAKPATDIDKKWAELYATLTKSPGDVAAITDRRVSPSA